MELSPGLSLCLHTSRVAELDWEKTLKMGPKVAFLAQKNCSPGENTKEVIVLEGTYNQTPLQNSLILRYSWIFSDILRYSQIFSDILGCSRIFSEILRDSQRFSDILGHSWILSDILGHSRIFSAVIAFFLIL